MNNPMRQIEVDKEAAQALEKRAAEIGISVAAVVSELVLVDGTATASATDLAVLDRRWAKIEPGEETVPHEVVAKWLATWGEPVSKPWLEE
jgi:hypothetical protein